MEVVENAISHLKARNYTEKQIDLAIQALEKQIAKSPLNELGCWKCPNCKSMVCHEQLKMYCRQCGQSISRENV